MMVHCMESVEFTSLLMVRWCPYTQTMRMLFPHLTSTLLLGSEYLEVFFYVAIYHVNHILLYPYITISNIYYYSYELLMILNVCVSIIPHNYSITKFIIIDYQILLYNTCNLCICLWQGLMSSW